MVNPTDRVGKGGGLGQQPGIDKLGSSKQSDDDKFQTALSGVPFKKWVV